MRCICVLLLGLGWQAAVWASAQPEPESAGSIAPGGEEGYARQRSLQQGDAFLAEKKFQHALNAYSEVILKEPAAKVLEAYLGRARALAGLQDIPKAVDWAQKATEAYPDSLKAYELLGELYLAENYLDPVRAEGIFRQMLELAPDNRAAHMHLARALSYLKKIEQAVSLLQAWLERHPEDLELRYKLAESHFALADLDQAEAELSILLAQDAAHVQARRLLETIQTRKRWAFWLPLVALMLVPALVFGYRHLKRGRIPRADP